MPGPLKNHRHEAFVQYLLQGERIIDAHERAGFARDDGNSARLGKNPKVVARLRELQDEIAGTNKVTVATLLEELEQARQKATDLDQLSAATTAIMGKAKLAGLLINRTEIGGPGDFSDCHSIAEIADEWLSNGLNPSYEPYTAEDRQGLIDLLTRQFEESDQYIASIKARPVKQIDSYIPKLTVPDRVTPNRPSNGAA